jgi:hypothetical protein
VDLALNARAPVAGPRPGAPPSDAAPAAGSGPAGPQRHLWHSRFGLIVIEVRAGEVFVNGQWVQPWRG